MKQFFFSSAAAILFAIFSTSAEAKLNVFACEPEWQALVEQLGGDKVDASSGTTAFQDPHFIEARPSLIAKSRRADIIVCTGAELEVGWLPLLLRQSGNAKIQRDEPGYFMASAQVERIEVPTNVDRSQGDVHASGNPHVHWDPRRILKIAEALTKRLSAIDNANASYYQERFTTFQNDWQRAIARWEKQAAPLKGKKVIVYHKSWSYLLQWLNIERVGDLEPKPGLPPTSGHLSSLLKSARTTGADYILLTNYQDERGAKWLSEKLNVPVLQLPFTVGGSDKADSLIGLYDDVINRLVSGKK